jgi:hypothetical protein
MSTATLSDSITAPPPPYHPPYRTVHRILLALCCWFTVVVTSSELPPPPHGTSRCSVVAVVLGCYYTVCVSWCVPGTYMSLDDTADLEGGPHLSGDRYHVPCTSSRNRVSDRPTARPTGINRCHGGVVRFGDRTATSLARDHDHRTRCEPLWRGQGGFGGGGGSSSRDE